MNMPQSIPGLYIEFRRAILYTFRSYRVESHQEYLSRELLLNRVETIDFLQA
jgi:hypothetical protein